MSKGKKRRSSFSKDKAKAQKAHFRKRVRERLGIFISKEEYNNIVHYVNNGDHQENIIYKQSNRVIGFRYLIQGKEIVIIWDRFRKTPITAMKELWLRRKYQNEINYEEVIDLCY